MPPKAPPPGPPAAGLVERDVIPPPPSGAPPPDASGIEGHPFEEYFAGFPSGLLSEFKELSSLIHRAEGKEGAEREALETVVLSTLKKLEARYDMEYEQSEVVATNMTIPFIFPRAFLTLRISELSPSVWSFLV